jgi:bifunctional UDP-N-acetylglucosamine pyrophosphorylase / glucosamine-1-phosphate N-acetyltransferase
MPATAVILAAGFGTRMKSRLPKVLHKLAGRPMLRHLIDSCAGVFDRVVVVVGPEMDQVAAIAAPHAVVVQHERLGTAHAARQAETLFGEGEVAVLYGDSPLITAETIAHLLARVRSGEVGLALLAMRPGDPGRYGRVIGGGSLVERIVEYADASPSERATGLCNAGVLCAEAGRMRTWLEGVRPHNAAGEYYLTDLVALARADGLAVAAVEAPESECRGINSRAELAEAEAVVQRRLREAAMAAGVTMTDPSSVFLCADTSFGRDVTIAPNVVFGPGVSVADDVEIRAFCHIEGAAIGPGAVIGPFARLRPGTEVGEAAHVGNFVELKAVSLGAGAKANHLTYLGDAEIGARTNIGAGTITCNYDGFAKHRTRIGADCFIGSDAVLVAPLAIGAGAMVSAGSVITRDVAADATAFGRARQDDRPGMAAAFRARHIKEKN